ncbi:hypothetical protein HDV01_006343 [Terramyces sp. JEL0728]|nr:hypothetical protein HDV01_006343 [Terramyces sp. JEL0728]
MIGQIITVQQFQKYSKLKIRTDKIQEFTLFNSVDETMIGRFCFFKSKKNVLDQLTWVYKEPTKDTDVGYVGVLETMLQEIVDFLELDKLAVSMDKDTLASDPVDRDMLVKGGAVTDTLAMDKTVSKTNSKKDITEIENEQQPNVEFNEMTVIEYMAELEDSDDLLMDDLESFLKDLDLQQLEDKANEDLGESIIDETILESINESETMTFTQTNDLLLQLL